MDFACKKVTHEAQYFADAYRRTTWRTALAEPMPGRHTGSSILTGQAPDSGRVQRA